MKFAPIFILQVLFTLHATALESEKCATEFNRRFDDITVYYNAMIRTCEQIAKVQKRRVEADFQEKYELLSSSSHQNCYYLLQCNRLKKEIDAFGCLVNQTWENTQMFTQISHEASQNLLALNYHIQLIEDEQFRCTNDTVNQLVLETHDSINELLKCNEAL